MKNWRGKNKTIVSELSRLPKSGNGSWVSDGTDPVSFDESLSESRQPSPLQIGCHTMKESDYLRSFSLFGVLEVQFKESDFRSFSLVGVFDPDCPRECCFLVVFRLPKLHFIVRFTSNSRSETCRTTSTKGVFRTTSTKGVFRVEVLLIMRFVIRRYADPMRPAGLHSHHQVLSD